MIRDLLVATTGHGDDAAAVSAACTLADAGGGHVAVLVQVRLPLPDGGAMGVFPAEGYAALSEAAHRQAEEDGGRWREALRRTGVMGEVRLVEDALSSPAQTAARQARYADLTVIGLGDPGSLPAPVHDQIAKVLEGSGRPLLVVPMGSRPMATFANIVIGWRPGAHATRAVHDALPLLHRAKAVHVVCVDPHRVEGEHGEEPGADIARHLARHRLAVTVHVESGSGDEPGDVLLRRSRELGADLLVIGGYSHSRFREWILGGTTRHVLRNTAFPVLLAR